MTLAASYVSILIVRLSETIKLVIKQIISPPKSSGITASDYTERFRYRLEILNPKHFFLINQQDALIIQIYSVIKLYMFRASSLPIIKSFLLYIRHW
jgi:hypothetical protein